MADVCSSILHGPNSNSSVLHHEQGLLDLLRHGRRSEALDRIQTNKDEINQVDDGSTPLLVATTRGWNDVVETLVRNGANVNAASELGETPLMRAIKSGKIAPGVIKLILDTGGAETLNHAAKEDAFFSKWTALHFACDVSINQNPAVIALLVAYGANTTATAANGKTPLDMLEQTPDNQKAVRKPRDFLKSHPLPMHLHDEHEDSGSHAGESMPIGSENDPEHGERQRASSLLKYGLQLLKPKKSSLSQQSGNPTPIS